MSQYLSRLKQIRDLATNSDFFNSHEVNQTEFLKKNSHTGFRIRYPNIFNTESRRKNRIQAFSNYSIIISNSLRNCCLFHFLTVFFFQMNNYKSIFSYITYVLWIWIIKEKQNSKTKSKRQMVIVITIRWCIGRTMDELGCNHSINVRKYLRLYKYII